MKPLITCRELIDWIGAYVEGELPAPQRVEFDRHMAACDPCVAYLQSYRATIDLARAARSHPEGPVPKTVPDRLVDAVLSARRRR